MAKILIIIAVLSCIVNLWSVDQVNLTWNKPAVQSEINFSWLQMTDEEISLSVSVEKGGYDLAVRSWQKFKKSLGRYIARTENGESFFIYKPAENSPSYLKVMLQAGSDFSAVSDSNYYFLHYGWNLQGRIGEKLYFFSAMWTGHFSEAAEYVKEHSGLIDSWTKQPDDTVYLDNIRGKLLYSDKYLEAALGRGRYETGSNIGGSIILADACNDYGYLSLELKLGDFSFSVLNASLVADSVSVSQSDNYADYNYSENKYLTIHDLSWRPTKKLHLFVGEEVIYGGHSIELSYLLPVNFIRAVEHNLGDKDNVMIYGGWEWQYSQNCLNYSNLLLDELRKSEIFGDWWGNKYAMQFGNVFYLSENKDKIAVEFTAVRPWLYTHKSIFTKYSHDNRGLGFPEGSNLIQAAVEIDLHLTKSLKLDCLIAFIRQGETGNNWEINYQSAITDIENEETKWLAGNPENRYKFQSVLTWQPLAHHWIKAGVNTLIRPDEDETELYLSWLTKY